MPSLRTSHGLLLSARRAGPMRQAVSHPSITAIQAMNADGALPHTIEYVVVSAEGSGRSEAGLVSSDFA